MSAVEGVFLQPSSLELIKPDSPPDPDGGEKQMAKIMSRNNYPVPITYKGSMLIVSPYQTIYVEKNQVGLPLPAGLFMIDMES